MRNDPFSKYDPEVVKTVQRMRLLDNDLMNAVLSDIQCTQLVLRIIMDKPNLIVLAVRTQGAVHNLKGRSVCFDVLATDSSKSLYDIEIQRADKGAGCKRARYNSTMIDSNVAEPGDEFDKLPETYVIFITENDVLGRGQLCYRVDRRYWDERSQEYALFEDAAHIIYVNAALEDGSSALGHLMADFRTRNPEDMHFASLREKVQFYKESPEGVDIMCKAVEDLQRKAAEKSFLAGYEKGKLQAVAAMVKSGLASAENAARIMDVPLDTVIKFLNDET